MTDKYKCENCGKIFDEFEMNYKKVQEDKKCLCKDCREKNKELGRGELLAEDEKKGWLEHWKHECSGIDRNERKGKAYCEECDFKMSCDLAYEQITKLIQQSGEKPEKELLITEPEYDRITIKVRGARIIFYVQWDSETGKEYYKWIKVDDIIHN